MTTLTRSVFFAGLVILLAVCSPKLSADDDANVAKESPSDKSADDGSTHIVTSGPLKVKVTLDGVFEATTMHALAFDPKQWGELVVEKALPQGTKVKPGDAVLWLNTAKIDKEIESLQRAEALAELQLKESEIALQALEKTSPLDLTAAKAANKTEQEDLAHYLEVARPFAIRNAHRNFQRSQESLEYAQEEFNQLKKMYEEDDLTEETEEIILKRAQRAVESAKFYLESAEIDRDQTLKFEIPRQDASKKLQAAKAEIAFQQASQNIPLGLSQAKLNLAKLKLERKQAKEKLAELKRDRAAMVLKAPIAGLIYYGDHLRGKWTTGSAVAQKLRPGGKLSPREVVMTIAASQPLRLRVEVPEKELHWIKRGLEGRVASVAWPELSLTGVVSSVSNVPVSDATFDAKVDLAGKGVSRLVPGMNGQVKFVPYANRNALLVPKTAVFTDEWDDEERYVYLVDGDKHERRNVTVGNESGDNLEITDGLAEGNEILRKKPHE